MKKVFAAVLVGLFAVSLSACTGASLSAQGQVKQPAAGYEHPIPMGG